MSKVYVLRKDESGDELYRRIYLLVKESRWNWQSIGAVVGLSCGVLSIFLGLLLWACTRLTAPGAFGSLLDATSTALLVLPLPLLAFGAYCLDLLEKKHPTLPSPSASHPARTARRPRLQPRHHGNN